jgi:hypothetical protein
MKIFSISVWGDNPRYSFGAHRQYELAKHFYPDFEFRLYTDDASKFNMPDANIIEVKDGSYGMLWRLLAMFESEDNIVISRDADSRINEREALATYLWLESPMKFHVMRDHDAHLLDKPILAGIFGAKGKLSNEQWNAMQGYLHGEHRYGSDEEFLRDHVYDESQSMIHQIHQGWFGISRNLLLNKYNICGNGWTHDDFPLYPPTIEEMNGYNPKKLPLSAKFAGYPK